MRKLIIPNTSFEPVRFLWMIEPGDIILLDKLPSKQFMSYLCRIKKIPQDSFEIITPESDGMDLSSQEVLLNEAVIKKIKATLINSHAVTLFPYFFNATIIELANRLAIPIDDRWRHLVKNNVIEKLNDKTEFRNRANQHNIPHPIGTVCHSMEDLSEAIPQYLSSTGKIIIKQPSAGGGLGNIGVSYHDKDTFFGVHKNYLIKEDNIKLIAKEIWLQYTNRYHSQLIIEVYYPHTKTITAILNIDERNQIQLVNTGNIYFLPINTNQLNEQLSIPSSIQAIQMPAVGASQTSILNLIHYSYILAQQVQQTGYRGLLSVDAIITDDDKLKLTEINVRNGGETHINYLINNIFDQSQLPFNNAFALLSSIEHFSLSLDDTLKILEEHELLFNQNHGIIIITLNKETQKLQYLVLAQNEDHLNELQQKCVTVVNNHLSTTAGTAVSMSSADSELNVLSR